MRREIVEHLELDQAELRLLDRHTLLNLFNILEWQLRKLSEKVPGWKTAPHTGFCLDILLALSRDPVKEHLANIEEGFQALEMDLAQLKSKHPELRGACNGLRETLAIGQLRIREYQRDRFAWEPIAKEAFRQNLFAFLKTTASVSGNRFSFAFDQKAPTRGAYVVDLEIGGKSPQLRAPIVLQDVIRDLTGNARKYSAPGSLIRIQLIPEGSDGLRLKVTDQGIGIPEAEISKVVYFGYRASNVYDRRTMGGGFGLTKAYLFSKECGGRFFIETGSGRGTSVELTLFPSI